MGQVEGVFWATQERESVLGVRYFLGNYIPKVLAQTSQEKLSLSFVEWIRQSLVSEKLLRRLGRSQIL